MSVNKILFIGNYPNQIDSHLNIFFKELIYSIADIGINCVVVAPVSITKYKFKIRLIPEYVEEHTRLGSVVKVYHPRYLSYSAKKILSFDTHTLTVRSFRSAAIKLVLKKRFDFDVVYGHFINIGGIPACVLGKIFHKPSFVANGESDLKPETYNYESKYNLLPFKDCTGVISVSTKNKEELISRHLIDPSRITVIPNCVDLNVFYPRNKENSRKQLNLPLDKFIIGFVGSFSYRKGEQRLLDATKDNRDIKIILAGSGKKIEKNDQILFCNDIKHEEIPTFLSCCDAFVLPTLNEGCSNAIVEAIACGLPVISSDLPFNNEILDETNGIRINPLSIDEIRNAILRIKNCNDYRQQLRDGAVKKSKDLSITKRAQKILEFINENQ